MELNADVIFMPYNYILDPKVRDHMDINLENAIIILDEGHNVEKICEDSACTLIDSSKIRIALRDLNFIISHENLLKGHLILPKDVEELFKTIETFQQNVLSIKIEYQLGDKHDGDYMFSFLQKANINEDNCTSITMLLHTLDQILFQESRKSGVTQNKCPEGIGLRAIQTFLTVVFSSKVFPHLRERVKTSYKVYIEREPQKLTKNNDIARPEANAKRINFWCFSPVFAMEHLRRKNIRNLILTSGTLAPLKPIVSEMEFKNPVEIANPHIIRDFQIMVKIVGSGPNQIELNSKFKNRNEDTYLLSLGQTILEYSMVVPDGLLVFFPSYPVMNTCLDFWRGNGVWQDIYAEKQIFIEVQTKHECNAVIKDYCDKINEPNSNGAIFMAIMRGKVSEGLDFADVYGRAVIICGIPYAPCKESKVELKKQYLNANRTRENQLMTGDQWYVLDAIRAINQAIGRVIRHKDDYGAILFCDNRFHHRDIQKYLSSWVMQHLHKSNEFSFRSTLDDLRNFYNNAEQKLPIPVSNRMIEYFDDGEEEDSAVGLPSHVEEPDIMDDSGIMDFVETFENQNNKNEYSPSRSHNNIWRAPERPERLLIPIPLSVISPSTSTVPPSAVPIAVSVPELDVDNNIECDQMVLDDNAQSQHAQPIVAMDSEDNIELMEALDNYEKNLTS